MVVDNSKLLELPPPEVASYLRGLVNDQSEASISAHILAAVERQSLPPTVFSVWLSVARTPETLLEALRQEFSVFTRRYAIKRLCKLLRRRRWRETWEGVGGIPGVLSLLKGFSVSDVSLCLLLLPRTVSGPARAEKQANVTELLKSLLSMIFPDANFKNSEERPFFRYYQLLFPGCNTEFVDEVLRDGKNPLLSDGQYDNQTNSRLLEQHHEVLRQHCLDDIFGSAYTAINIQFYLGPLLHSVPALPTSKPGISESMAFSMLLLRRLVAQPDAKAPLKVLTELVEPLLRRAKKKKVDFATMREILDLSITYLSAHPAEARHLSFNTYSFLYICIKMWVAPSAQELGLESRLVSILGLFPSDRSHNMQVYGDRLQWVRKPVRYKLLKLFLLHVGDMSVDIDDEKSLKKASLKKWPSGIFFAIDRRQALGLLKRLRATSPRDDFLECNYANSILSHPPSQDILAANSSILLNILEVEEIQSSVQERATSTVEDQKKKAATSREQVHRAFHAKSALFFAISSGSLELYRDTLKWARRFVRDPLTVKTIFAKSASNTSEGISLLSGIPKVLNGLEASDIASRIQFSNHVMFDVFETACSALNEPSFYRPDWAGPLDLIGEVVFERLTIARRVQDALHLSNDQTYQVLWSGTLELLLRVEKIGLETEYERLQFRDPSGPIKIKYTGTKLDLTGPSLYFLDSLAKARDSVWRGFRPTINAAVAALPSLVPRGLPIQCLATNFEIGVETAHGFTPFIMSRAESLVFMQPEEALLPIPEDEETTSAIGTLVDSFTYALQIYVYQGDSLGVRESRRKQAWKHALENLSEGMSSTEAYRTWKRYFVQALPRFEIPDIDPKMNMDYPLFPFGAEVGEYTEWNPAEYYVPLPAEKSRQLSPLRYLDCTLGTTSYSRPHLGGSFVKAHLQTIGFEPPSGDIWSLYRLSGKQSKIPALREGLVVSALLFLEQYILDHKSVLTTPFPSITDVRYPDVWLDLSFAELKGLGQPGEGDAFQILKSLSCTVPPSLLYKLMEAALNALFNTTAETDAKIARLEGVAYKFLLLLAESDRPSLATDFILKIVIDRPDSSSWHRQLLSMGFLRSLSANQAKALIQSFADAIQQKTKEATDFKEADNSTTDTQQKAKKPYVKITTVKYLAQLLQGADFVSESFAVDILSGLLTTSTHIDVRAAIVGSLMEMLTKCQDDSSESLGDRILQVLESVIPIAGRLDERLPVEEEEWEEAKRIGKLPAIHEQGSVAFDRCIPPILGAILNSLRLGSLHDRWQQKLLKRILLPILEISTAVNTRWLDIFTAKHGLNLRTLSVPLLPVKVKFLKEILQSGYEFLPPSLMDLYHKFILISISPPLEVAKLNEKLQDPTLHDLPEVKHWLSLYGHGPNINHYDGLNLVSLLRQDWPYPNSHITATQIQTHVYEQAELLLSTNQPNAFDNFIRSFQPYSWGTIGSGDWLKNAKPVLQRIIALIDSLRTPEWQRNRKRQPEVLPQTLKYRLWLLPYPSAEASEAEATTFADAVLKFVSEISQSGKLYHEELPTIHAALKQVVAAHRPQVSCLLGTLKGDLGLMDLLCVEIAKALLVTVTQPVDESAIAETRKVVKSWMECENEGVRGKGLEVSKMKGLFGITEEFGLVD